MVETPNKKEFFVFDNIADEQCAQQDLYQYIGQDAVKSSTQVLFSLFRDIIAAFLRTARLVLEKLTRSWVTLRSLAMIITAKIGESYLASLQMFLLAVILRPIDTGLNAPIWRYTTNKFSI